MAPRRSDPNPRSYGRQASGKTIKSLSLQADVATWAEAQAEAAGMSLSAWIEEQLAAARTSSVIREETKSAPVPPAQPVTYKAARRKR